VDVLTGGEPEPGDYRIGWHYRAEMRELGYLAHALGARDLRAAMSVVVPRRHTTHAVLSVQDPKPALRLLRRVATRVSARALDQMDELRPSASR
jgi:hypothetical protein